MEQNITSSEGLGEFPDTDTLEWSDPTCYHTVVAPVSIGTRKQNPVSLLCKSPRVEGRVLVVPLCPSIHGAPKAQSCGQLQTLQMVFMQSVGEEDSHLSPLYCCPDQVMCCKEGPAKPLELDFTINGEK